MTGFRIETVNHIHAFRNKDGYEDPRFDDWPVVYTLRDKRQIYVGESLDVRSRFLQHHRSKEKQHLTMRTVVLDDEFNKSAALDLESHLVRWFSGDNKFQVLNRNEGIVDADYYGRDEYRSKFQTIFKELRKLGLFDQSSGEIENSNLFKFSPFKALTQEQEAVIHEYVRRLAEALRTGTRTQTVVQGDPGTGKTIVGIYLMKLLADIASADSLGESEPPENSVVHEPEVQAHIDLFKGLRIGLVAPQQSLRNTLGELFKNTSGLSKKMVLTPFQVGKDPEPFDVLIVDEAHRLGRRANQSSAGLNRQFTANNERLFGDDDPKWTQLDWIEKQSRHQVLLVDPAQSVKPADISEEDLQKLVVKAKSQSSYFPLNSQLRMKSGPEYISYLKRVFSPGPPQPKSFPGYDLRWFDDVSEMADAIREKDEAVGLSRMLAGFAWEWKSKGDKPLIDIKIGDFERRWNVNDKDWVNSPTAIDEVGCIHVIQGYDLNYAGVIIGPDLKFDPATKKIVFDRKNYFDTKGKENLGKLGIENTDEDLLRYVIGIYVVLMTRGIFGTYVYVYDPELSDYLRPFFNVSNESIDR